MFEGDPHDGYPRPTLKERASDLLAKPWFVAVLLLLLMGFQFDMFDPLVRPFALRWGKATTALVTSKRVSHGSRAGGNYLTLNYQYSPDYAPRPEFKVNDAAYASIGENTNVKIHYLEGCSSCVALDEDYGTSYEKTVIALVAACVGGAAVFFQFFFRR